MTIFGGAPSANSLAKQNFGMELHGQNLMIYLQLEWSPGRIRRNKPNAEFFSGGYNHLLLTLSTEEWTVGLANKTITAS